MADLRRALTAEAMGSALLFATVVGSGIMGERLAGGNAAMALIGNTAATGAMLFVLITLFGPISGAHFNPAVSMVAWLRGEQARRTMLYYVGAQLCGGVIGLMIAHGMFDLPLLQWGVKPRHGPGLWLAEAVATFGLILTIWGTLHARPQAVAASVALYIVAGYWFTSSTSFANPAITLVRAMTDSFAGIASADAPAFIAAQVVGALIASATLAMLFPQNGGGHKT